MKLYSLLFIFLLSLISGGAHAEQPGDIVSVAKYFEILPQNWTEKSFDEIGQSTEWKPAYSTEGKTLMSFQGNWYRLNLGKIAKNNSWILLHPHAPLKQLGFRMEHQNPTSTRSLIPYGMYDQKRLINDKYDVGRKR